MNISFFYVLRNKQVKASQKHKFSTVLMIFMLFIFSFPLHADELTPKLKQLIDNSKIYVGEVRLSTAGESIKFSVPEATIVVRQNDVIELIKEQMPNSFNDCSEYKAVAKMRVCGHVWNLRSTKFRFEDNMVGFHAVPDYRVENDSWVITHVKWKWRGLKSHPEAHWNWKNIARKSGKVDISGTANIELKNPGSKLSDTIIVLDVKSGEPNVKDFPNWAEQYFKPDGKSMRERIKEAIDGTIEIPVSKISGSNKLEKVTIKSLSIKPESENLKIVLQFDINT